MTTIPIKTPKPRKFKHELVFIALGFFLDYMFRIGFNYEFSWLNTYEGLGLGFRV